MPTRASVTIEDFDGEKTTTQFWVQDMSALNFDSVAQDVDEVKDAIALMVRGVIREVSITKVYPEDFVSVVNDPEAQRETKWKVTYRDTTQFLDAANTISNPGYGNLFVFEVGTAELTGHLLPNSEDVNMADQDVIDFIAGIQPNIRSPYNHSANAPSVEVVSITHVGKNT